jgi:hypothetical protein
MSPVVTNTTMSSDSLVSLDIGTDLSDENINNALRGLAINSISLSVHEPGRYLELLGVVDDSNELLDLFVGKGTSTRVTVNFGLLAEQVGKALAKTGNLGKSELGLALSINIGVQHTQDVL